MNLDAEAPGGDNPLAPMSSRFPLGLADGMPPSDEPPSRLRPFSLRFARELQRLSTSPWPPHRYCPHQQMLVTDDVSALPLADHLPSVEQTTLVEKDGHGKRQEDWKPDLPHDASP